jgi:hypothetical protein
LRECGTYNGAMSDESTSFDDFMQEIRDEAEAAGPEAVERFEQLNELFRKDAALLRLAAEYIAETGGVNPLDHLTEQEIEEDSLTSALTAMHLAGHPIDPAVRSELIAEVRAARAAGKNPLGPVAKHLTPAQKAATMRAMSDENARIGPTETLAEFFERTKSGSRRSLRRLGHPAPAEEDGTDNLDEVARELGFDPDEIFREPESRPETS